MTQSTQKQDHSLRNFLVKLAVIALCIWLSLTFLIGIFRMSGNQMYPAIRDGDLCITYRLGEYYGKDAVVYRDDTGALHFGRIIARGGDTVDVDETGLLINGSHPSEEIFYPTDMTDNVLDLPCTLEQGEFFVLNDFRSDTGDSRSYGLVTADRLQGKVILILRRRGI